MTAPTLLAILAMALATYATRVAGLIIGPWLPRTGPLRRALDALPAAVLTALVAPAITAGWAEGAAAGITALCATRLPTILAVAAGILTVALVRALA